MKLIFIKKKLKVVFSVMEELCENIFMIIIVFKGWYLLKFFKFWNIFVCVCEYYCLLFDYESLFFNFCVFDNI